jgi:monooxygenase
MPIEHFDVVIIGAGLSGIGAGYRLQTRCPRKRYVIFEARPAIGGTWDLFRFPGIRSDSDMFTFAYPFRPWKEAKAIADGPAILNYLRETAQEFGIDRHIRFQHRVHSAS